MGNEINRPQQAFRTLLKGIARERANAHKDPKPKGFWTTIVYEYIVNNPGCTRNAAARSIEPHRSLSLGYMIIKQLIKKGWIMMSDDNTLSVVGKSTLADTTSVPDLY